MFSLLIAEDEVIEQKALRLLVEKNFPDIRVVAIANNGIKLVVMAQKYNPDIAIVDITMPGMSGLEAIELLRHKQIKTRFIINTAYDEFEFAKKAIGLKVDDYILKPQRQEQTIETIRKLRDAIYEEKVSRESQLQIYEVIKQIEPVLENEIMFSIFLSAPAEDNFHQYCEMHALSFGVGTIVSMLSLLSTEFKFNQADISQIRKSLNRSLGNCCNYLASINASSLYLLVFREDTSLDNWETWLSDLLSVALENLHKELGIVMKAGVGRAYHQFNDMSSAYRESLSAIKDGAQSSICFFREKSEPFARQTMESDMEKPVSEMIMTDNSHVAYAMKYIDKAFGNPLSLELVADEIGVSTYYLSKLFKQELGLTFTEYLTSIRMKNALIIAQNTKISVNEIAAKVGYSHTTYFTRVFKQYTGKTVSEIRKNIRVGKFK